ncbi:E3 ubiquitin-protein ligase PRT1 isoform X2 [Triticum aestivum]|uniref:E3 ubiquitin-protein ligase PRT1 isoform X2 n=1 Tax=Triticum aestivum TaxID=4565 RepID=UPI001D008274|nr:E3 ubiquitin-protein ligase PRT1-like isoform X2 [Triticum aestivum]
MNPPISSWMAADNKMHFLKLEEEVVIPTTFKCAITYDLLFKPVVLVCGHTFSFWSIAEHMSILVDTLCPLCKTQFAHFPKICETYHTLVKKLKPAEYARVEAEFLEQERSLGRSSPPVDVGLQDELCFECNKLLYKPSVLNCGHVCCKSCLPSSDGLLACKRCGSVHPGKFPSVCISLDEIIPRFWLPNEVILPRGTDKCGYHGYREIPTNTENISSEFYS